MNTSQKPAPQPVQPVQPLKPSQSVPLRQPVQSVQPVQPASPIPPTSPVPQPVQVRRPALPGTKPAISLTNRHNLFIAAGIGLSIITVLIAFFLVRQRVSFFSRARTPSSQVKVSRENSYIFASPVSAFADGISIIRVTVIMLSNQGLGVSGQTVKLKTSKPLTVNQVKPATDDYGRAIFDVTANTPGDYTLSAETSDLTLSQTVSIAFQ